MSYYDEAYMKKREIIDEILWMNGRYTMEAFGVILANAFKKEGSPPEKYREMPIMTEYREQHHELTEEEKQAQIQLLFGNLEIMKNNFERTHGE